MRPEPLTLIATCDLVAMVRGRAVPARDLDAQLEAAGLRLGLWDNGSPDLGDAP